MKRKITILMVLVLGLLCTGFLPSNLQTDLAAQQSTNQITVLLNGEKLSFDVNPYIKGGRTLVPFRGILEALGAEVIWNPDERSVTAKNKSTEVYLKIGSTDTLVNGSKVVIDVPAEITGSRTFVPLRFVSENLGATVAWDGTTRTVTINYKETVEEDPVDVGGSDGKSDCGIGDVITYKDSKIVITKVELDSTNKEFVVYGKVAYNGRRLTIDVTNTDGNTYPAPIKIVGTETDGFKSFEARSKADSQYYTAYYLDINAITDEREKIKIGKIDLLN
ncbi:copper amine oxidase N-terminal domain-containing protein [Acetivibrio cellulolyticus]|uniref:copper amine oxidase N-terminal domain-containing protein n=1 Tax=Acetivibrio cellulolyticus TaxID=35830 RepID=UPI0001E2C6E6|nr:copper amine oxidase N-terminal domain-containing protein [Acetivibrio cellulolyticus]